MNRGFPASRANRFFAEKAKCSEVVAQGGGQLTADQMKHKDFHALPASQIQVFSVLVLKIKL